jgi:hypothetical protein
MIAIRHHSRKLLIFGEPVEFSGTMDEDPHLLFWGIVIVSISGTMVSLVRLNQRGTSKEVRRRVMRTLTVDFVTQSMLLNLMNAMMVGLITYD